MQTTGFLRLKKGLRGTAVDGEFPLVQMEGFRVQVTVPALLAAVASGGLSQDAGSIFQARERRVFRSSLTHFNPFWTSQATETIELFHPPGDLLIRRL